MSSAALLEQYRPALTGHCYRMLGSVLDAEDAVQESVLRAWRGLDRFNEQSSMKTWFYRIATDVCLDTLSSSERRRMRPLDATASPLDVRSDMTLPQHHDFMFSQNFYDLDGHHWEVFWMDPSAING